MKSHFIILLLVPLFLLMFIPSGTASAISTAQRNLYRSGINWFDVDSSNGFCGDGSGSFSLINPGKLYILGDSIINGAENGSKEDGTPKDYLRDLFTGDWDLGVKGESSDRVNGKDGRHVYEAIDEINKDKALVVDSVAIIIALGTNDAGADFSDTITSTIAAVREHNETAPIFWVDVAVTTFDSSSGNSGIHSSASEEKYEIIPWFTTVFPDSNPVSTTETTDSNDYLRDGVHPNVTGNEKYSQLMFDSVSKYQILIRSSSPGTVNVAGSNNSEKVFNYFRSQGLSEVQSAAIVGNYMVETRATMDPSIKQGSLVGGEIQTFSTISEVDNSDGRLGYGLAQWTHDSRQTAWVKFVRENGHTITDLSSQLEWTWYELGSNSSYGKEEFLATTDLRQSTWIFVAFYERPGSISGYEKSLTQPTSGSAKDSLDARYGYAQEALASFSDNPVYDIDSPDLCLVGTDNTDFSATGVRIDGSLEWIGDYLGGCTTMGNCSDGFTEGARTLKQFVLDTWQPHVEGVGGYCCRPIRGISDLTSIHGMGRALDIYLDANNTTERTQGDQIRNWMISNSAAVGVQRVIWNRYSWRADKDGWNDYCRGECTDEGGSKDPHTNHLHVEINTDGANEILSWYIGR